MGEDLAAALGVGISEADFWRLTPYRLRVQVQAVKRSTYMASLYTGWFTKRLDLETKLQPPQAYVKQFFQPPNEAEAEAQAEAMFHRMAQDWGLEVEPYSE